MAYWWVNQGRRFDEESTDGCLSAPGPHSANYYHWAALDAVRPGDIILSYVNQSVTAISAAISTAELAEMAYRPPAGSNAESRKGPRRRIRATYTILKNPIPLQSLGQETRKSLAVFHGPLNKHLTANQGYLFPISESPAHAILALADQQIGTEALDANIASSAPTETEREAISKARVGQGQFRTDLFNYWDARCAVTGVTITELLRASHIKPWRDSNNSERLDVFNGLLLSPAYDAAFDARLISFTNDGRVLVSSDLDADNLQRLGLNRDAHIPRLDARHHPYLQHHRAAAGLAGPQQQ